MEQTPSTLNKDEFLEQLETVKELASTDFDVFRRQG